MAVLDLNEVGQQGSGASLIPPDSCVIVTLNIIPPREGMAGAYPELTHSQSSSLDFLNTELVVAEGTYRGTKIYHRFCVSGASTEKQKKAVDIAKKQLRALVECARHIDPADSSPAATQARMIESYSDFEGMTFPIKVGCEASNKPKKNDPSHYFVNNCLVKVLSAADSEFEALRQPPYELLSGRDIPEFPVSGSAASAGPAKLWSAQQQNNSPAAPAQQGWGASQTSQAQASQPAASAAPLWAQQPVPQTDQVPF